MGYKKRVEYVELEEIKTAKTGAVLVDHYWIYKPGVGVAFYRGVSNYLTPQANRDLNIALKMRDKYYKGHDVALISTAYLGLIDND